MEVVLDLLARYNALQTCRLEGTHSYLNKQI